MPDPVFLDTREQILERLVVVARSVIGIKTAERNVLTIDELHRPAIQILDSDEVGDDADPSSNRRGNNAPRRILMTPEIYLLASARSELLGPAINVMRRRFLYAVLHDADLAELCDGQIRYDGAASALGRGRAMVGEMGVSITFPYILSPAHLAEPPAPPPP